MNARSGRPPEQGDETWATIPEAARALGITAQAIRNRIERGTAPGEQIIIDGKPHWRVPREWLDKQVESKSLPATQADTNERTAEILGFLRDGLGGVTDEIRSQREQVVPRLEEIVSELRRQQEGRDERFERFREILADFSQTTPQLMGELEQIKNNQQQIYRQVREAMSRMEEEGRQEAEYQQNNLQLARENRDLQRQNHELLKRVYDLLATVQRTETTRDQERRQRERRGFLRRLFGS